MDTENQESRENKLERLRKLDASITKKGTLIALIIDILGVLIMETGMSLEMSNLGNNLVLNYSL